MNQLAIIKEGFSLKEILSVTLILFSVIDIVGNIPIVISMKKKGKKIESSKATIVAGLLMIAFLFAGESILHLVGVDVGSFAIAGAIVIFIIGLEMILDITIMKEPQSASNSSSIVPVAFPLIAGAGTLTTILSLKAEYVQFNILIGIIVNLIIVYVVLRSSNYIQNKLGDGGANVLRKIFGIILLAIAIKLFKSNWVL
ncbi:MAG: MarC family protein [Chitinophagales bacterium]